MWPLRDIQQSCPFQVFALSPLRATQALFASKASLRRKSIPEVILLCFEQVIPAKIIWQPLFLALLEMITAIYPPTPPVVCRLPSDPTLLPYFLNWSIPGGPVTPCSDFWSFFLPSPGLLYFWGFFSFAVEGPAPHMGAIWACRMTQWDLSNTPGPQAMQFGATSDEKPLETAGEREQCNSYDNCGYRSIYLFILQGSEPQLSNSLNI